MATLQEVIEGLQGGQAYERTIENDGGKEYVKPTRNGEVHHIVAGESDGGWGGEAILSLDTLSNGHWADQGWQLSH